MNIVQFNLFCFTICLGVHVFQANKTLNIFNSITNIFVIYFSVFPTPAVTVTTGIMHFIFLRIIQMDSTFQDT